jgi:hypothetical protein
MSFIYKGAEWYPLTSFIQAKFRLENGDAIMIPFTDSVIYMIKKDDKLLIHREPKFGKSATLTNKFDDLERIYNEMIGLDIVSFYSVNAKVSMKEKSLLHKVFDEIAGAIKRK